MKLPAWLKKLVSRTSGKGAPGKDAEQPSEATEGSKMSDEKKKDPAKMSSDELKKQILGSMSKPFTGEQTSRWIANMDDESLMGENALNQGPNASTAAFLNVSSVKLVDKIFDEFQRYVYEYLRTPAGQNFVLNVGRPQVTDTPTKEQYGKVPVLCQGHVSTANWAIIFVGQVGKVLAFITPVDYTVGFKPAQDEFQPFVEIKSVANAGKTDWLIQGYSISTDMLPIISKRFFGALIKVERQEAKHTDKFVMDPTVQEEEKAAPVRLEESDRVELMSDEVMLQHAWQNKQFQQNPQYQSNPLMPPQNQQNPQMPPQNPQMQASQPQQYFQQQQQAPAQNYQNPAPSPMPQPVSSADPGEIESVTRAFDRNKLVIDAAIEEFMAKMDLELDTLTKIGMKTIQVQDMAGAQRTIIRSAKLKEMRQRVNDLSNEWKAVVSES